MTRLEHPARFDYMVCVQVVHDSAEQAQAFVEDWWEQVRAKNPAGAPRMLNAYVMPRDEVLAELEVELGVEQEIEQEVEQELRELRDGVTSHPIPGLQRTLTGTCVACLTPTDTALGYSGSLEGHAAFLVVVGIPEDQAVVMVESSPDRPLDVDPEHPARWVGFYQLCAACAERAGYPAPVLVVRDGPIPTITVMGDH